jgi:hypothetical protein
MSLGLPFYFFLCFSFFLLFLSFSWKKSLQRNDPFTRVFFFKIQVSLDKREWILLLPPPLCQLRNYLKSKGAGSQGPVLTIQPYYQHFVFRYLLNDGKNDGMTIYTGQYWLWVTHNIGIGWFHACRVFYLLSFAIALPNMPKKTQRPLWMA